MCEPLKNKGEKCCNCSKCPENECYWNEDTMEKLYWNKDVVSAVKWLKRKIEDNVDGGDFIFGTDVLKYIDEAFEDAK